MGCRCLQDIRTIAATNSGTSKIYNSSSDYYNYTLVRDPNTKEWSLVAPNAQVIINIIIEFLSFSSN